MSAGLMRSMMMMMMMTWFSRNKVIGVSDLLKLIAFLQKYLTHTYMKQYVNMRNNANSLIYEVKDDQWWPSGNTLASDASDPGSTHGRGTLKLDTGCHRFGVGELWSNYNSGSLLLTIADVNVPGVPLPLRVSMCVWQVTLRDPIKHGPCLSSRPTEMTVWGI